jgi:hypothetical protein
MTTTTFVAAAPEGLPTIDKDPSAKLDYSWDWGEWLDDVNDTIASYVITVAGGVVLDSHARVGGVVTGWISGGAVEAVATAACKITTTAGRIDERTIGLRVIQR